MNINYRLGIILPSYNDERVVNAIESIIKIDKNRLSKIYVIDGNSGEKITNKISNQLRQHDIHISEPDHGPFDALNQGLDIVEEEIIGWLGADDRYPTDIDKNLFESLVLNFDENPRVDALVYNCVHLDGEKISRVTYAVGSNDILKGRHNPHYSTFIRKSSIGDSRFNLKYKNFSDIPFFYDLTLNKNLNFIPVNQTGVLMEIGGVSNTSIIGIIKTNFNVFRVMRDRMTFHKTCLYIFNKIYYKLPFDKLINALKSSLYEIIKTNTYIESFLRWNFIFKYKVPELEIKYINNLPKSNKIAIDVGAAEGFYSYALSKKFSEVYSYEPHPTQFNRLNFFSSKNVKTFKESLSDVSGDLSFFVPIIKNKEILHESRIVDDNYVGNTPGKVIRVPSKRLDDELTPNEISNIGLIKIDVEGFELEVLHGMRETIKKSKPIIFCEIEARHNDKYGDVFNFLDNIGYQAYFSKNGIKLERIEKEEIQHFQNKLRLQLRLNYPNETNNYPYINNFIFINRQEDE